MKFNMSVLRAQANRTMENIERLGAALAPEAKLSQRTIRRRARALYLATQELDRLLWLANNNRANWPEEKTVVESLYQNIITVPTIDYGLRYGTNWFLVPRAARRSAHTLKWWVDRLGRKVGVFSTKDPAYKEWVANGRKGPCPFVETPQK